MSTPQHIISKQIKDSVSCLDCLNAIFFCMGPKHQFDQYWREGKFDMCRRQMRELRFCMKLKFAGPKEAREMAKQLLKQEPSPTEGIIWQPRISQQSYQAPNQTENGDTKS